MRILIIEDERELLKSIQEGLSIDGYYVDMCDNGFDALEIAQSEDYDLILLDLNLPGIDGLDILRKLRASKSESKILILSARSSIDDRVIGLDARADDYLIKPFAFEELEARIRCLFRRDYIQEQPELRCSKLKFDSLTRTLYANNKKVSLTKKETAIIEYFLYNKDKIISSEELISHAWDINADLFSNSVRVHIHSLRKKIKTELGYDPIINKIGEGYLLKSEE